MKTRPRTVLTAVLIASIGVLLLSQLARFRFVAGHTKCAENLRVLHTFMTMYAAENAGAMPSDLADLAASQDLLNGLFVCPRSGDVPSEARAPDELRAAFAKGGHCSYIYVGSGVDAATRTTDALTAAKWIIAFEPLENHGGHGMNVLLEDGQVQFVDAERAATIVTQHRDNVRPIRIRAP